MQQYVRMVWFDPKPVRINVRER